MFTRQHGPSSCIYANYECCLRKAKVLIGLLVLQTPFNDRLGVNGWVNKVSVLYGRPQFVSYFLLYCQ